VPTKYQRFAITPKGRLFVALSTHYLQDDGSCECGWKPSPKNEYPDDLHMAHLAEVAANEMTVFPHTVDGKRLLHSIAYLCERALNEISDISESGRRARKFFEKIGKKANDAARS
jgi:hypothetical protein